MRYYSKILCLLLIALFIIPAFAQQRVSFEQISVPDGLSSNGVYSIYQDRYGFLWIATSDGLNRYDGYKFDVFKHDPADSTSLPSSIVSTIMEDSEGTMWIGTTEGLCERDPDTGQFRTYEPASSVNQRDRFIIHISEDRSGRLWIGTRWRGIYLFDRKTKTFSRMKVDNNGTIQDTGGAVNAIIEMASGDIYTSTIFEGLLKYDEQKGLFRFISEDDKPKSFFPGEFIWYLHEDKSGNLWLASDKGLYKYHTAHSYVQKIEIDTGTNKPLEFRNLYEDKTGNLWIGSESGLFTYNLRTGAVNRYNKENQGRHKLSNHNIWSLNEDSFGVLWVGTQGGGLFKYDRSKIPFDNYTDFTGETNDANISATYAIAPDYNNPNHLWIGTGTGLWHLDRNKKSATGIELPADIGNDRINAIISDRDGFLWLATHNNGLLRYTIKNGSFSRYRPDPYEPVGLQNQRIFTLEQDDYGDLWVGTQLGLSQLDPKSGNISRVPGIESRMYDRQIHSFVDSLSKKKAPLAAILKIEDLDDKTQEFIVETPLDIAFITTGEGLLDFNMVDYGWIENDQGDTIVSGRELANTFHLGGGIKNRIQINTLTLSPGKYRLRYLADDSHTYGKWNVDAPRDSSLWGVQVFTISQAQKKRYGFLVNRDLARPAIEGLSILSLCYSRSGDLWVGTGHGLSRYNPKSGNVINYRHICPFVNSHSLYLQVT